MLGPVTHGNALSVYFLDPEGNRVEFLIDTPWHVPQPYRIPVDLSLPDEELWASIEQHVRADARLQAAGGMGGGDRAEDRAGHRAPADRQAPGTQFGKTASGGGPAGAARYVQLTCARRARAKKGGT